MKYALKPLCLKQEGDFTIVDEKGLQAFWVDSTDQPTGKKLSFRDRKDTELAFINQKLVSGGPTFEIYHGDDLQAVIDKKTFDLKCCTFRADISAPDDLRAEGNLADREYTFTREGRAVGRVSKTLFGKGNYGVEVGRGEDELLLLAGACAIDLCCQARRAG